MDEADAFCFKCGTDIVFSTKDTCQCPTPALEYWVIRPAEHTTLDETYWFPQHVCVISSYDGSFSLMTDDGPFAREESR